MMDRESIGFAIAWRLIALDLVFSPCAGSLGFAFDMPFLIRGASIGCTIGLLSLAFLGLAGWSELREMPETKASSQYPQWLTRSFVVAIAVAVPAYMALDYAFFSDSWLTATLASMTMAICAFAVMMTLGIAEAMDGDPSEADDIEQAAEG